MPLTYLIAGGSKGIGLALVQLLREQGHRVIVLSRTRGELAADITHYAVDFSHSDIVLPTIGEPINGIVYLPGSISLKPFKSYGNKDFIADFQLNVLGAVQTIRQYLPNLQQCDAASIVLASTVAVQTGMAYHTLVGTVKGAVEGLAKSLAAELAAKIRVNVVAPSLTDTALAARLLNSDDKRKSAAERHPLKKIGQPVDIAQAIAFLLGGQSSWITGQVLHIDGGMSAIRSI